MAYQVKCVSRKHDVQGIYRLEDFVFEPIFETVTEADEFAKNVYQHWINLKKKVRSHSKVGANKIKEEKGLTNIVQAEKFIQLIRRGSECSFLLPWYRKQSMISQTNLENYSHLSPPKLFF